MTCSFNKKTGFHFCLFSVPEEEIYHFDGRDWCEFHLPMEDGAGNKGEKAEWDKEKINTFNQKIFTHIDEVIVSDDDTEAASLSGVVFPGDIDFSGKSLPNIYFDFATFNGMSDFENTTFNGDVSFQDVTFNGSADFSNAVFQDNTQFENATFVGFATFDSSSFSDDMVLYEKGKYFNWKLFDNVTFSKFTSFKDVVFSGGGGFHNAIFNDVVVFESAVFKADSVFTNTTFMQYADFTNASFNEGADFSCEIDQQNNEKGSSGNSFQSIIFDNVEFSHVSFTNRNFRSTTSFRNVIFEKAPKFHNCELHQDTDFTGAVFKDKKSKHASRSYRSLKLAMEQMRARDEHARFYALEQKSIRKLKETPGWVKLTSMLYEVTSNYGQSALRPLVGLTLTFVLAMTLYQFMIGFNAVNFTIAVDFAFDQIIRPFSAWATRGTAEKMIKLIGPHNYMLVRYVAAVQSIISLVFITLFILAIRWRYRRA